MLITLYNKRGPYLEYYPDLKEGWVHSRWIDQLNMPDIIEGTLATLECLKSNKLTKMLNDNRELVGHWSHAIDWIEQEWLPQALAAGLKKFAHILSHYSYGQTSAKEMQQRIANKFEMQLFNNIDDAKIWLRKYK